MPDTANKQTISHTLAVPDSTDVVSWYFEPSQPQRITSGLKQTSICLLFTHLLFTEVIKQQNQSGHNFTYNKTYTNIKHKIFKELVPLVSPQLKKAHKAHAGIMDHFINLSIPDF